MGENVAEETHQNNWVEEAIWDLAINFPYNFWILILFENSHQ